MIANILSRFELFHQGNEDAFKEFYNEYKERIFTYALVRFRFRNDVAEDATALAFARLWENREKIKSVKHIEHSLFMIVRNIQIDTWRAVKLNKKRLTDFKYPFEDIEETRPYDLELLHSETLVNILKEIEKLSDVERKVVKMIYFDKRTGKNVARELDLSESAVTRIKQQACNKIRIELLKKGITGGSGILSTLIWLQQVV